MGVILPLLMFCVTAATLTPIPGVVVEMPYRELPYISANSVREPLKPTVLALATLLPMVSSWVEAAFKPLKPC